MNDTSLISKYDYREEWARFVATLSAGGDDDGRDLASRIIKAVGGVVGATGGAVWLHEEGTSFRVAARKNYSRKQCGSGDAPVLAVWLVTHDEILDLSSGQHEERKVDLPDWLPPPPDSWVLLPLQHRGWLFGFMILQSAAPRALDREDRELLGIVARDAASYLAEAEMGRQLREAKAFEMFNRRFAFVMHDLKNMGAQLKLTLSNAEKHKRNPDFVDDMIETLEASVGRMEHLISRMRGDDASDMALIQVDQVIRQLISRRSELGIQLTRPLRHLVVRGDESRLSTAIEHVLDNAAQSAPGERNIKLTLRAVGEDVRIEISDDGHGMDDTFIQDRLYAPFSTTKPSGFGLGMTETREIIEKMNGRINIESAVGEGTTVSLGLPRIYEDQL